MSNRGGRRHRRGGNRHQSDKHAEDDEARPTVDEDSPVAQAFLVYQKELDFKHDKYERLVKLSRDITIESKRTIFLLHRSSVSTNEEVLADALIKLNELCKLKFEAVAVELEGEDPYQFVRAFSPGLQEYIEALSYYHVLNDMRLVTFKEVQEGLVFHVSKQPASDASADATQDDTSTRVVRVLVTPTDYILGIADLTGELMRMAISSVGLGELEKPFQLCSFLREIYDAFVLFGNAGREISRKLVVLRQSLAKVESACYLLQVRQSEIPDSKIPEHMLKCLAISANETEGGYHDDVIQCLND